MTDLLPSWLLLTYVGLLGAVVGSYLNVLVWRLPREQSTTRPRSACPSCGHAIRWFDNVPVLSWLVLRGRCRDCGTRISVRYPLVEAGVAVLFVALVVLLGPRLSVLSLLAVLALAGGGVAMSLIDLEHHRLPDKLTAATSVLVLLPIVAEALLTGSWSRLLTATVAAVALFVLYLGAAVVYPGGMGGGDIKLAPLLGFVLGWFGLPHAVVGAFAPFLLGVVAVLVLAVRGRVRKGSGVPFGPFMLAGTFAALLWAPAVAHWYLEVAGLA
ncbi:prepilin peptidase [Pseudactinotalea terrae]|uniref:prepilin peptidase n=1 Tax=Pseudactinotalea terrae TaxID=1743262 RepID=UPI001F4FE8F9|nr:A24 family peptidase [Pseudactinotalea terrae]